MNEKKLFNLLNSKEYVELEAYYEKPTFLDILGVSRNEKVHSNFLAWLFNPKSNHGLGDFALRKLLEMCHEYLPKNIKEGILIGKYDILQTEVEREVHADKVGYLDLFIKLNIVFDNNKSRELYIIIENKIESSEGVEQTKKYQNWCNNNEDYKDKDVIMIYLSSNNEKKISGNQFIKISYTEVNDMILSYCVRNTTSEWSKYLISDYICCLSQPLINSNKKNDINHSILAISAYEINTVKELMSKYNDDILYIINELVGRNNQLVTDIYKSRITTFKGIFNVLSYTTKDVSIKDKLSSILENVVKNFKYNNMNYKAYGKKRNSIGYLVRDIIANYCQANKDMNYIKISNLIQSIEWLSPWVDEVITNTIPKNPEHFFMESDDIIIIGDDKCFVARYWTSSDAIKMASLLNQKLDII